MNKKFLSILLSCILLLALATGCGGDSGSSSGDTGSGSASSGDTSADTTGGGDASSGNKNITLVLSQRDEWLSTLVDAAEAAAKEKGYNMNTVDCLSDVSKAIQFVESARNAGEEVVIVNLVDPSQAGEIIEAAGSMKVVFVNRLPGDMGVLNENAVYVGSNEREAGVYQAKALAEYFKAQGKTDVKYILLNGILGQASTINRTEGVLETLASEGINATEASAPLACDYDRANAMDQISPLLTSGTQFDCIISNNDAMALGAVEAMKSASMDPSAVPIVGVDCTADGAAAVAAGEMYMTVFQNAVGQGSGAMQAAINLLNGDAIDKDTGLSADSDNPYIVWVPFEPVTADNVANYQ
ncbi:MAG: substrate-binding domain-containing protein [Dysosmobacter sp.]|nr:substrate-binding domain-containing protein [Dysosmobacter sp.]